MQARKHFLKPIVASLVLVSRDGRPQISLVPRLNFTAHLSVRGDLTVAQ